MVESWLEFLTKAGRVQLDIAKQIMERWSNDKGALRLAAVEVSKAGAFVLKIALTNKTGDTPDSWDHEVLLELCNEEGVTLPEEFVADMDAMVYYKTCADSEPVGNVDFTALKRVYEVISNTLWRYERILW